MLLEWRFVRGLFSNFFLGGAGGWGNFLRGGWCFKVVVAPALDQRDLPDLHQKYINPLFIVLRAICRFLVEINTKSHTG